MSTDDHYATLLRAMDDLDTDTNLVFEALSSPRRRCTLACLGEHEAPVPLHELAGNIAAWELHVPKDELDDNSVDTIHVSLYHVHVPKLADAGLVEYDRDRDLVTETDMGKKIASLDVLPSL